MDTVDGASAQFHMKFLSIFKPLGFCRVAEEAFTWRRILQSPTVRSLFNTAWQKSEAVLLLEGPLAGNDRLVTGNVIKTNMSKQCMPTVGFVAFRCF